MRKTAQLQNFYFCLAVDAEFERSAFTKKTRKLSHIRFQLWKGMRTYISGIQKLGASDLLRIDTETSYHFKQKFSVLNFDPKRNVQFVLKVFGINLPNSEQCLLEQKIKSSDYIQNHLQTSTCVFQATREDEIANLVMNIKETIYLSMEKGALDRLIEYSQRTRNSEDCWDESETNNLTKSDPVMPSLEIAQKLPQIRQFPKLDTITEESTIRNTELRRNDTSLFEFGQNTLVRYSCRSSKKESWSETEFENELKKSVTFHDRNVCFQQEIVNIFESAHSNKLFTQFKGEEEENKVLSSKTISSLECRSSDFESKKSKVSLYTKETSHCTEEDEPTNSFDQSYSFVERSSLLKEVDCSECENSVSNNEKMMFKLKYLILVVAFIAFVVAATCLESVGNQEFKSSLKKGSRKGHRKSQKSTKKVKRVPSRSQK